MALIVIAAYDTIENDRTKYTKECLTSLLDTVDFYKHRIIIIDNNSCDETKQLWHNWADVFELSKNIGTANAVNFGLKRRNENEVVIKMDNDCVVHQWRWVDEMEAIIQDNPKLGIVGLKRDDVWQSPTNPDPRYRTILETLSNGVEIEICDDIMGTCTAYNPLLLDKVGYLSQPSLYGFDDVLISARSIAAGFTNCFLPKIKITHLDDYKNPYSDWKKREANIYLEEVAELCKLYKEGKLSYYYDGGFND